MLPVERVVREYEFLTRAGDAKKACLKTMAEILLIDDEDDLLRDLRAGLTARGHQIRCLNSADGALEILESGEIELVVVDEIMPRVQGSELLKMLREQGIATPAILMTGQATRTLIAPMKQLGVSVVTKPMLGTGELIKDLASAVDESLKGEAKIVAMVSQTVGFALERGKTPSYLHWLLDCELRTQISALVNHDAEKIKQMLGEVEVVAQQENSLRLKGEIWHLRYEDESADYPRKGNQSLDWLQTLLTKPNKLFTVAELRGDPEGKLDADAGIVDDREVDDGAVKKIKERLEEIEVTIKATGGSEFFENEKKQLEDYLVRAGRGHRIESPLRREHRNIAVQLRALRDKRLARDMPRLVAHLRASLRLDYPHVGYYPPPGTPAWQI